MSIADMMKAVEHALSLDGDEQAKAVDALCAMGVYARQNIGYLAGYYPPETAAEIYRVFKTAHPIFGTTNPSAEAAFDAGVELGHAANRRGDR